jgi:putative ATPase
MRELDYGKGYRYAHDDTDGLVDQEHLPEKLSGRKYYHPTNRGYEALVKDRLTKWRQILKSRKEKNL